MIIPVRCFTCGAVISDKWIKYTEIVNEERTKNNTNVKDIELLDIDSLTSKTNKETAEHAALEKLNVTRVCCRRHFLCNVDLVDII
jgi:DNA-directed RNA polymerase I, II, and III subunit RPABC5|tara:strand:- start:121 stop:378 length:258 start_codon:yes stop_codon:yes gene_type:complete